MNYAILDGTTVVKTGKLQTLFPNTSFPASGVPSNFLSDNNMVELLSTLPITAPTQKLVAADPYLLNGKVYNVTVESTTDDEKTILNNSKWEQVRLERDSLLQRCDWRASSDLTLSEAWKNYRQALRDVPSQSDPFAITWPTEPS